MRAEVSVIIPTIATPDRQAGIHRAIRSVLEQQRVDAVPIVVVNGSGVDPTVVDRLRADRRIRLIGIDEGNVSRARYAGVCASDRPFFAFLDDDDELVADSISRRLDLMADGVDIVLSNGYLVSPDDVRSEILSKDIAMRIETEPIAALMQSNWFSSGCGLYRSASFPPSFFDLDLRFYECTWLALAMIEQKKVIRYSDTHGYLVHQSTAGSVTKTKDYWRAAPEFIRKMRGFQGFGSDFDRVCQRKLVSSLNLLSLLEREWGHYGLAWLAHLRCLRAGGWRYLPYTRRLLRPRRP